MYRLTRNVHLVLGLFSAVFLFAYGLSAFEMAHSFLFRWSKAERTTTIVERRVDDTPRATASRLMSSGMVGDLTKVTTASTSVTLTIMRPGTVYNVAYVPNTKTATVVTTRSSFIYTLNRIHHVTGTWHDHWVITAWTWFLGLVSVMLFGIGISGVYMWFKRNKERRFGVVMLSLSLGVGGGLVVLLRFVP
jgi:hypothetical protein